jgi:hypothetical protein
MAHQEKRLRQIFSALPPTEQHSLLAFAEFLEQRALAAAAVLAVPEPQLLPRPPQESVVAGIKRLSASYPMLDRSTLLNETSSLMTQHLMQGRSAKEVIDEMEVVFLRHYELFRSKQT